MKRSPYIVLMMVSLYFSACTSSIHDVHVSDFEPFGAATQLSPVEASSEQFAVMGFVQQTDYVDEAYNKLISQCPGGEIKGIVTQFSTKHGFLSWTNKILLKGFCVRKI